MDQRQKAWPDPPAGEAFWQQDGSQEDSDFRTHHRTRWAAEDANEEEEEKERYFVSTTNGYKNEILKFTLTVSKCKLVHHDVCFHIT